MTALLKTRADIGEAIEKFFKEHIAIFSEIDDATFDQYQNGDDYGINETLATDVSLSGLSDNLIDLFDEGTTESHVFQFLEENLGYYGLMTAAKHDGMYYIFQEV